MPVNITKYPVHSDDKETDIFQINIINWASATRMSTRLYLINDCWLKVPGYGVVRGDSL
ncbi:MAG: hypothetical protein AB1746_08290 [Candidatus Zixiibacteriota bacterium]